MCTEFLPVTLAPNMVTLIGFFGILLQYTLTLYYIPTGQGNAPNWIFFVNAFCLFWYMTLDAIDGKQARRTNCSSALGELFDHGCDALTSMFQVVSIICATQQGGNYKGYVSSVMVLTGFIFVIWEQYYTGVMRFSALTGPTEAILVAVSLHLTTGIFGTEMWLMSVKEKFTFVPEFIPDFQFNFIGLLVTVPMVLYTLFDNIQVVLAKKMTIEESKVRGSPIYSIFSYILLLICWSIWIFVSPTELYKNQPIYSYSIFGFVTSYIITRLVLSRVCKMKCELIYLIEYPMPIIALLSLNSKYRFIESIPIQNDYYLIAFYTIYSIICYIHFVNSSINSICEHLKINCLSMTNKQYLFVMEKFKLD